MNKMAINADTFINTGVENAIIIIKGSKRIPSILFIKKIINI